ncbi:hypothetical protein DQ04_02681070 [Trypanosoma grayi]|uniref:hypothetical protein n=1 Tax=Trypanosoma grayi TaxID=71804 RepID=UPI0004F48D37|nr:hypothetical protein DQ04_02681070 [Trypanosoma grayi]KEG11384.1 hypothetical protein DQ04_02681070 [Trypanosoma grayi]
MPLDLVGKLHRTVYIEGCPPTVREDLLRLLVAKCGAIDGWDVVGERIIVLFSSMNSISTAITFNGTAFGDLTSKLILWVATESPPAGVTQQMAITGSSGDAGAAPRSAEELKSAREARERRLAAIRAELAPEIERAESADDPEVKRRDLCGRQLKALCVLTAHAITELEKKLEDSTTHLHASQQLLASLREKKEQQQQQEEQQREEEVKGATLSKRLSNDHGVGATTTPPAVLDERDEVTRRVEAMVDAAEDIGRRRVRSKRE